MGTLKEILNYFSPFLPLSTKQVIFQLLSCPWCFRNPDERTLFLLEMVCSSSKTYTNWKKFYFSAKNFKFCRCFLFWLFTFSCVQVYVYLPIGSTPSNDLLYVDVSYICLCIFKLVCPRVVGFVDMNGSQETLFTAGHTEMFAWTHTYVSSVMELIGMAILAFAELNLALLFLIKQKNYRFTTIQLFIPHFLSFYYFLYVTQGPFLAECIATNLQQYKLYFFFLI